MKKIIIGCLVIIFLAHKFCLWAQPFGSLLDGVPFSQEVLDRNGQLLRLTTSIDQKYRLKTNLSKISPLAIKSTLLYEDRYFRWHFGVNPISFVRAIWTTYIKRQRVVGASTITMQLARVMYKINSRSLLGKLSQIGRSLALEFLYSKNQILEAYFNLAPYGFNIEGIGAASRIYFDKPAKRLSFLESLTLSVIPQSPYERTKQISVEGMVSEPLKLARAKLLNYWIQEYKENVDKSLDFKLELGMRHPRQLPFDVPHLVSEVIGESSSRDEPMALNVDLTVQKLFENVSAAYFKPKIGEGIKNFSALLVDTRSMEVVAHIGSRNFYDDSIQGQVNGVRARRSPGSALKPFAYGLALDQGVIHPLSILKDSPHPFGTYTPDNFDKAFSGPLSATDALIHSRNIPAIHISQSLSGPSLYEFLKSVNIPLNPDPQFYGLSIVLGTAEVTMEELVQLYSIFNNEGLYKPIRKTSSDPKAEGQRILTKEASYLIKDMLSQNPPAGNDQLGRWQLMPKTVAWKTGTSVGFRDAWAVGVFDHYAMAVWVGNFNGEGNTAFVGRSAAGPLFFSFIDSLNQIGRVNLNSVAPSADLNLSEVDFCAVSGELPHKDCAHRSKGLFIPGVSPITHCHVHRRINVDPVSGMQVCHQFKGQKVSRVYEFWPTDLLKLFKEAGIGRKIPPPLHPDCIENRYGQTAPQIMSPKKGIVYNLRTKGSDSKFIPLLAVADGGIKTLSWWIDNEFIGLSKVDSSLLWEAKSGQHTVLVKDESGMTAEIDFDVHWVD